MAARVRRNGGNGLDAWPGYVDALSTLLMVIIFVLLVFVLAQAFLTVALSGRSHELDKANQQLAALTEALSLERGKSADLQFSVSQLSKQLTARAAERDQLTSQLADANLAVQAATAANARLQSQLTDTAGQADAAKAQLADAQNQLAEMKKQIADLDQTVAVDKDTLQAKLSDLANLANQSRALEALRDDLEKQAQDAAARAMTEQQRREAVEAQLSEEKKLGDSARAQIALLNQQIDQLKAQLVRDRGQPATDPAAGQGQGRADRQPRPEAERGAGREGRGIAAVPQRILRQAADVAGQPVRNQHRRRPLRVPE